MAAVLDRSEGAGLAIAVVGHALLLGVLSLTLLAKVDPPKPLTPPVEVSLVEDVGLRAQAPAAKEPPAPSQAPVEGPPEKAAAPEPAPAPPETVPTPKPAMKAAPPPAPVAKPLPKPVTPPRPAPAAAPAKPLPPTRATPAKPAPAPPAKPAEGKNATAEAKRQTGKLVSAKELEGLLDQPSPGKAPVPRAAVIDAKALATIQDAIRRQIQPCADRQVNPGPGANQIVTTLNLRLNRDGTLAADPSVVRQTGVDDDNDRYRRRVIDLGIAAFKGCAPLRLPPEFYQTANGGWSNINYNWQLR